MKRIGLTALLCMLLPGAASAADAEGNYAIKGAGIADCNTFVEAREEKSSLYFRFGGWMEGYLTAVNEFMDQTYDVSPWQTTELLAALVANHCQRNPEQNFGGVIRAMAQTLGAERLERRSDFVEVATSGETVRLYRSVVEQVQRELANKGFYNGAVDGDFGPGTQAAMRAFQESTGLPEPTGLPDQMSLFRLLVDPQAMGSP